MTNPQKRSLKPQVRMLFLKDHDPSLSSSRCILTLFSFTTMPNHHANGCVNFQKTKNNINVRLQFKNQERELKGHFPNKAREQILKIAAGNFTHSFVLRISDRMLYI